MASFRAGGRMWTDVAAVAMTVIAAHWMSNAADGWRFIARLDQEPRLRTTQAGHKVLHLRVSVEAAIAPPADPSRPSVTADVSLFLVERIESLAALRAGALVAITGALVGIRECESEVGRRIVDVVASNVETVSSSDPLDRSAVTSRWSASVS